MPFGSRVDNNYLGLVSTSVIEGNVIGDASNSDTLGLTDDTADVTTSCPIVLRAAGKYRMENAYFATATDAYSYKSHSVLAES